MFGRDENITRTLRVGLLGAAPDGGWGAAAHVPALAYLPGLKLEAVCNRHPDLAAKAAVKFGARSAYSNYEAMLADQDIDIVSVCVRVPEHYHAVSAALAAGKNIYCEWPLGASTDEAQRLHALAVSARLRHAVGLQARFSPRIVQLRNLISSGHIGDVVSCTAIHSWPHTLKSAYLQDETSGATLLTIPGGHMLDVLQFALGEFRELSALAQTLNPDIVLENGTKVRRTSADQIAIHGTIESGAVVAVQLKTGPSPGTGLRIEVNGTKGDLILTSSGYPPVQMTDLSLFENVRGGLVPVKPPTTDALARLPSGRANNVGRLYAAFAEAIIDEKPFVPDFGDAVKNHRLLDCIRTAARTGSRVVI